MAYARARSVAPLVALALAACGCSPASASTAAPPQALDELAARDPALNAESACARLRSLRALAAMAKSITQLGAAPARSTAKVQQAAFALNSASEKVIYALTAIYISNN